MIRLDKFLCDVNLGTRSQVKAMVKKGMITINGTIARKPEVKIDEAHDIVRIGDEVISYSRFQYLMLHKPAGVVTATKDDKEKTVMDLIRPLPARDLFPVGRLDKDTEGLLLITNNGDLAHRLLSPKKHVAKTYLLHTALSITEKMIQELETGVDIGDDKVTLPAAAEVIGDKSMKLTIVEGRYHQVKRMLHAVGNEVIYLKRLQMGSLFLDENLKPGEFRYLTDDEVMQLEE